MHNHRDQLEREGVLVVGPNPTFMQYISRVMPTISGATVMQSSVDRLSMVRPKHRDSPKVRRLKGDRRMATVLRNAMTNRIARLAEDLTFMVDSRNYNLRKEAVTEALDTVLQSRMPYMDGRTRFRDRVLELAATAVQERRGSSATSSASETMAAVRRQAGFRNAMERIWPSLSQRQLVQETLAGPRRLAAAADGVLGEDEVELLLREPASV
jgi:DNA helicase IV